MCLPLDIISPAAISTRPPTSSSCSPWDLPGHVVECLAHEDLAARVHELYAQVREYKGRTHAYQAQERQLLALVAACPCFAGAGK